MVCDPITSCKIKGEKVEVVTDFIFLGSEITTDCNCSHMLALGKKPMTNLDSMVKKQRHHFANKRIYSQSYDFSCSHICIWELDHKEGWALKNWCFPIILLEKTLESPLDFKVIKSVKSNENQSWIFIRKTDTEVQTFWPRDLKSWLIRWKRSWCRERRKAKREEAIRSWDG